MPLLEKTTCQNPGKWFIQSNYACWGIKNGKRANSFSLKGRLRKSVESRSAFSLFPAQIKQYRIGLRTFLQSIRFAGLIAGK